MQLSLFFFADDADGTGSADGAGRYRLLLDAARFADDHGLTAVWTPERHFHSFGGLYPNPSVTAAAVAAVTRRVGIRAGSVVLPLHDPVRVAEEWSVVDNLSGGRVGVSFASGWHANDFALRPDAYRTRRTRMYDDIEVVRTLWRGGSVARADGNGAPVSVRVYPDPVQADLPIWLTSSGNVDTCRAAGELGAGLLTFLLGQDIDELAGKIDIYREAMAASHPSVAPHVTLMLHTFLGTDLAAVRDEVRDPFSRYLKRSVDLFGGRRGATGPPTEAEADFLARRAFDRYFEHSGLFGTPSMAREMLERLTAAGVDEVGCLIDFGVDRARVMRALEHLAPLVAR
jgi:natural product biosynthesis luciferase-like monooxygenase protein